MLTSWLDVIFIPLSYMQSFPRPRFSPEFFCLAEVLRVAGVTLGKDLKGPLLANGLIVEAADGYRVVFALPEIDPAMN
jgi:hypothetical protein